MKIKSYVFAGAKEVPLIDKYIQELGINKLDLSVDFGWFTFLQNHFSMPYTSYQDFQETSE